MDSSASRLSNRSEPLTWTQSWLPGVRFAPQQQGPGEGLCLLGQIGPELGDALILLG